MPIVIDGTNGVTLPDSSIINSFPSGVTLPYAGSTAPTNWLLCDGSAVSRTTYAALFTALGTTYGSGDGSTTFNIPDLRGRAPRGKDDMGGTAANRVTSAGSGIDGLTLGASGGAETVTLSAAQMPSHLHNNTRNNGSGNNAQGYAWSTSASSQSQQPSTSAGSDTAHTNTGPTLILNYIIKT